MQDEVAKDEEEDEEEEEDEVAGSSRDGAPLPKRPRL